MLAPAGCARRRVEYAATAAPRGGCATQAMPSDPPIAPPVPAARTLLALTLVAVALSFFFALGRSPLFDVDEGAFSQATMEMFERGDFLFTYLNGQPRYDKPILVYWLQAASVAVLGVREFAFRFPSALCASLWVLLTFWFARRR